MDIEKFKKDQIEMLFDDFGESQIQDNIFRLIFKDVGNIRIEALIFRCMSLYAEIICEYRNQQKINEFQP